VPPLRARPGDVRALAEHFLKRAAGGRAIRLADETLAALARYAWPGNVRELRNVVERAFLLTDPADSCVELRHLPEPLQASAAPRPLEPTADSARGMRESVEGFERERIVSALQATGGNLTHAAELLKLPRKTLAYRLEKLGLRPKA
jgi:DNA-binding NtrC family response regulator